MASSGPSATTAAVDPGGADIDHMVGGANGVFVMLNDDHRVA